LRDINDKSAHVATVAIVGTDGIPAQYGGFETLAERIAGGLSHRLELTVTVPRSRRKAIGSQAFLGSRLKYVPFEANGIQSVFHDAIALFLTRESDCTLLLGVSGAWALPLFRLLSRSKIICHIDGLEWKRDKWNFIQKLILRFLELCAVRFGHEVVSDNAAITRYIIGQYGINPVEIAYGGDDTQTVVTHIADVSDIVPWKSGQYWCAVARIEPENNIHTILRGFKRSGQSLVLIGNWMRSRYGRMLARKFGGYNNLTLVDPIYDRSKLNAIRIQSRGVIHGHSAGGTNPALVEAMCLGKPVVVFDVVYNRETTSGISPAFSTADELRVLVTELTDSELSSIAISLQKVASVRYTWERVVESYYRLFLSCK
jgi:glycosyltransferase involved in cell wall biosynthesis